MSRRLRYYATTTRLVLTEHLRHRFALTLLVFVIPICVVMPYFGYTHNAVVLRLVAADETIQAQGNELGMLVTAFNGVTLLVGFTMFSTTHSSVRFDHRLAMAGYPRSWLMSAKLTLLVLVSVTATAYATLLVHLLWRPAQCWLLAVGMLAAALAYGAIGAVIGLLIRGELEGMFLIIATSIVDQALQNPVLNPVPDAGIRPYLPSYGATQTGIAAGFSPTVSPACLAVQSLWIVTAATCALLTFLLRTRDRRTTARTGDKPRVPESAETLR
ncbi:ABC transporter permease [Saccharothrix deserti]|uniref:ABC transporter permease n=1 Tax=Saccharothrix deserti TaxID=2593674 RepID=UPI00131E090C|nr:ABC transporter permease [Saccharothrix deserti]